MRYVLDASVGLKAVLPEPDSDKALALRDEVASGIHEVIPPDTYPVEIAHGLTRAGRRGIVPVADVSAKICDLLANAPVLYSYMPLLPRAFELSIQAQVGIYDCLYVALAEQEQCEFITADARLVNVFGGLFPILPLSSMP